MFNYYPDENIGFNDCAIQGSCSIDPVMYSLVEVLLYELKQITYYVVKMQEMGYQNIPLKKKIIQYLSMVIVGYEFNINEFERILEDIDIERRAVESVFKKVCEERNVECQILHSTIKIDRFDFQTIVQQGEKQAVLRSKTLSTNAKNLTEIILQILKSASVRLLELESYDVECEGEADEIIKLFNNLNFTTFTEEKLLRKINAFAAINFQISNRLNTAKEEYFGKIHETKVHLNAIKTGPNILVTGQNLYDLGRLLEAAKDEQINIYTHNGTISAHSYPKLKEYKNLVGHFQKTMDNFQIDFSAFNGSILITKNSHHKFERLFRGRIFTTNYLSGKGMSKIEGDDFAPLIKAAQEYKNSNHEEKSSKINVGYNEDKVLADVDKIIEKIDAGEIKHLIIVGLVNHAVFSTEYFKTLVESIPKDCYVISTAIETHKSNALHVNSYFTTSLIYKILGKLKEKLDFSKVPVSLFVTQCNLHTISHLFNIKQVGLKNIYMPVCSANIITPNMINFLVDKFGFKKTTDNAQADLEKLLKNNNNNHH